MIGKPRSRGGSKVIKIPGGIFPMASVFMKGGKQKRPILKKNSGTSRFFVDYPQDQKWRK